MNDDTRNLLRECSAGCKMAADSISQTISKVGDEEFKKLLRNYYGKHVSLGQSCSDILVSCGKDDKDAPVIAKAMSNVKTEVRFAFSGKTSTAAKLMMDGCTMGMKSVGEYLNKYTNADEASKGIANDIIGVEKDFTESLMKWL